VKRDYVTVRCGVFSAAIVALAVVARAGTAQPTTRHRQSHPDSVRVTADLFFRAVADERWDVAALLTDTNAVRQLVLQRLQWRTEFVPHELTIADFMRDDPAKPRAVAEYELKRFRERMAEPPTNPIAFEFSGVKSIDELAALSAHEATARFLQAQDDRVRVREMARKSGCPAFSRPFAVQRILGVVLVSDTVAFVLHEEGDVEASRATELAVSGPSVMQLRLRAGAWQIRPGYDLLRQLTRTVASVSCDSTLRRRPPG
jgi:hypothetical protein